VVVNECIDRGEGLAVLFEPALLLLGAHDVAQSPFERFGDVDAHALRLVEQLRIDEEIDRALLRHPRG
jgi:hypothetical protein